MGQTLVVVDLAFFEFPGHNRFYYAAFQTQYDVTETAVFITPLYFRHARTPGGISDTNDVCNVL